MFSQKYASVRHKAVVGWPRLMSASLVLQITALSGRRFLRRLSERQGYSSPRRALDLGETATGIYDFMFRVKRSPSASSQQSTMSAAVAKLP